MLRSRRLPSSVLLAAWLVLSAQVEIAASSQGGETSPETATSCPPANAELPALPPAVGPVDLFEEAGRWYRRDHGDDSVRPLPEPWCEASSATTRINRLEIAQDRIWRIALTLPAPIRLPDIWVDDLLEGAAMRWGCELVHLRVVDCSAQGGGFHSPARVWPMRLRGDRLSELAGARLANIDFQLHSIKPTLRIEPDHEALDRYQLRVLAPLALDIDALKAALSGRIDGKPVRLKLAEVPPPPPTRRSWDWTHPWLGPDGHRAMDWQGQARFAWSLQLSPTPKAGQRVEIWLSGPLLSLEGPLPGPAAELAATPVYQQLIPEAMTLAEHVPNYPDHSMPGLVFSRPPDRRTLAQMIRRLPGELESYPELLEFLPGPWPTVHDSRQSPGWRLPLVGNTQGSGLMRWSRGQGLLGERLAAGELSLQLPSPQDMWDRQSLRLPVLFPSADFALHAIGFPSEWLVVASESTSAQPLAGVGLMGHGDIELESQSGEAIRTDADGLAIVPVRLTPSPLLEARLGERRARLRLDLSVGSGEDEGVWFNAAEFQPSALYWWMDRSAYAPGEMARLAAWMRPGSSRESPREPPESVQIVASEFLDQKLSSRLSFDAGFAHAELRLPTEVIRPGDGWHFKSNGDGFTGGLRLYDAVAPSRMRKGPAVSLQVPDSSFVSGRRLQLRARASYAGGAPGSRLPVRVTAIALHSRDDPLGRRFPGFRFSDPTSFDHKYADCSGYSVSAAVETGEAGAAELDLRLPSTCEAARLVLQAQIGLEAQDAAAESPGWIYRHARQLGLAGWHSALPTGLATFRLLAVDQDEASAQAPIAKLTALRIDGGPAERLSCQVRADGQAPCRLSFRSEGLYRLLVEAEGWPTRQFRQAVGQSFALPPGPAAMPVLEIDQHLLAHGESMRIWIRHDYQQARGLLLLSDERLRSTQWLDLPAERTEPLTWLPPPEATGCFHLAMLVLPVVESEEPLRSPRLVGSTICIAPPEPKLVEWEMASKLSLPGQLRIHLQSRSDRPLRLMLRGSDASWFNGEVLANAEPEVSLRAWLGMGAEPGAAPKLRSSLHDQSQPIRVPTCGPEVRACFEMRGAMSWPRLTPWAIASDPAHYSWPPVDHRPPQALAWKPDLRLQPGERRVIEIPLPDYPAGWRMELIAMDGAGRVQQLQQLVEAVAN